MQRYYVIRSSPDGIRILPWSKKELEQLLGEEGGVRAESILDRIPNSDPDYWGGTTGDEESILIIKGEIVVPREKTRVTEWEVP